MTIRAFEPADAPRLCEIYYRSVHELASARYTKAQCNAWAPALPDAAKWLPDLIAYETYVAIDEAGDPMAWISMTPAGYIDMLFALPEAAGRGFAGELYEKIERIALQRGVRRMTAYASLLAQPFFAKRGWCVERHELHLRNGVEIPRAEMSKELCPIIHTSRLRLSEFRMTDAKDVYNSITPGLTKYMFWELPASFEAYTARRESVLQSETKRDYSFVIRRADTLDCLGIASVDGIGADAPELGLWIKESAQRNGYGTETVRAVAAWAAGALEKSAFVYSVAVENAPSRRIAEALGGTVIGTRTSQKYDSVVYALPAPHVAAAAD